MPSEMAAAEAELELARKGKKRVASQPSDPRRTGVLPFWNLVAIEHIDC